MSATIVKRLSLAAALLLALVLAAFVAVELVVVVYQGGTAIRLDV